MNKNTLILAPIKLKTKRIKSFLIFLIMMTICCFLLFFFSVPKDCGSICKERFLILILTTSLRFGITIFQGILVTYTSEIFPTSMRTKGYGICMTFGKLGCIIVPIYVSYLQIFSQNPLVYIGFFCLFAIALSFRLPETYDQQMKDRLDEADGRKEFEMVDKTKEKGEILESEDDIFTN